MPLIFVYTQWRVTLLNFQKMSCLAQLKKRTRKTENEALKVNDNTIIELSSRKISSQIWQRQIIDLLAPDIFAQPRPTIDNYKHVQV